MKSVTYNLKYNLTVEVVIIYTYNYNNKKYIIIRIQRTVYLLLI